MPILRSWRHFVFFWRSWAGPGNVAAAQVGMSVAAGRWAGLGGAVCGIGRGVT